MLIPHVAHDGARDNGLVVCDENCVGPTRVDSKEVVNHQDPMLVIQRNVREVRHVCLIDP